MYIHLLQVLQTFIVSIQFSICKLNDVRIKSIKAFNILYGTYINNSLYNFLNKINFLCYCLIFNFVLIFFVVIKK